MALHAPQDALPGLFSNSEAAAGATCPLHRRLMTRRRAGVAGDSSAAVRRRIASSLVRPAHELPGCAGLPSVSVPVLSITSVSIFCGGFEWPPHRGKDSAAAARPVPTTIAIGVARPSRRTGDDEDGDGIHQRVRSFGAGPQTPHAAKVTRAEKTTAGTNQEDTRSARRITGARLLWLGPTGSRSGPAGSRRRPRYARMTRLPAPFCVRPSRGPPRLFQPAKGSAVIMGFVDGAGT